MPSGIPHKVKADQPERTWDYWGGFGADGWDYCESLYQTAQHFKAKRILEIGFRLGKSALAFLKSSPDVQLVSIDIEVASDFDAVQLLKDHGVYDRFTFIEGRSDEILPRLLPDTFDLIYIDGSHTHRDIVNDFKDSLPLVKTGGVIVFDDWRKDLGYATDTQGAFAELGLEYKTMTDYGLQENPHGAPIFIK